MSNYDALKEVKTIATSLKASYRQTAAPTISEYDFMVLAAQICQNQLLAAINANLVSSGYATAQNLSGIKDFLKAKKF